MKLESCRSRSRLKGPWKLSSALKVLWAWLACGKPTRKKRNNGGWMLKNRSCSTVIPAPAPPPSSPLWGTSQSALQHQPGGKQSSRSRWPRRRSLTSGRPGEQGCQGGGNRTERERASEARPGAASREPSLNSLRLRGREPPVTRWRAT